MTLNFSHAAARCACDAALQGHVSRGTKPSQTGPRRVQELTSWPDLDIITTSILCLLEFFYTAETNSSTLNYGYTKLASVFHSPSRFAPLLFLHGISKAHDFVLTPQVKPHSSQETTKAVVVGKQLRAKSCLYNSRLTETSEEWVC